MTQDMLVGVAWTGRRPRRRSRQTSLTVSVRIAERCGKPGETVAPSCSNRPTQSGAGVAAGDRPTKR